MLAFEIRINGELVTTIGQEDMSVLAAAVVGRGLNKNRGIEEGVDLSLHGMSQPLPNGFPEHFRWASPDLKIDDEISIKVVLVENSDPPTKRYRSDEQLQEDPFTEQEIREMRYKNYIELKKEFEE